jgi:hypothetical protein
MTDQQPASNGAPSTDLTINDLQSLKVIIDLASSRGAFKPQEMVAVGQTYTKLATFLDTVAAQQQSQPAQQPTAPDAATAVTGA